MANPTNHPQVVGRRKEPEVSKRRLGFLREMGESTTPKRWSCRVNPKEKKTTHARWRIVQEIGEFEWIFWSFEAYAAYGIWFAIIQPTKHGIGAVSIFGWLRSTLFVNAPGTNRRSHAWRLSRAWSFHLRWYGWMGGLHGSKQVTRRYKVQCTFGASCF